MTLNAAIPAAADDTPPAEARALWYLAAGKTGLRTSALPAEDDPGLLTVRTLFTGLSCGTERLILEGRVPESEYERMRAPMQEGDFPFPVKYGYSNVGRVERGPAEWIGKRVHSLAPHQDLIRIHPDQAIPVPDRVPSRRAVLAANMETALNAIWDSGVGAGDRIAVVGGGVLGTLVAHLAAALPGAEVTLVDIAPAAASRAERLGLAFAAPAEVSDNCDCVFHASATTEGLSTALRLAGLEATVVELSWYGDRPVSLALGGAFHSRRLKLLSSQVGRVSESRRARFDHRRRREIALNLLADDRLDALLGREIAFADAPAQMADLLAGGGCPILAYPT